MNSKNSLLVLSIFVLLLFHACDRTRQKKEISRAFEFRYVSEEAAANDITDLKGPTSVFDLNERLDYLGNFADYGRRFFGDPRLNTQVVGKEEIDSALQELKSQPKPQIREKIALDQWKYLGYKEGQRENELQQIDEWGQMAGAQVRDEALLLSGEEISKSIAPQDWRMKFSWKVKPLEEHQNVSFSFSEAARVGLDRDGRFFYVTEDEKIKAKKYTPGEFCHLKVEIDLESGKYNFYANDELIADFVPLTQEKKEIARLTINPAGQVVLDDLRGVGYELHERGSRTHPYFITTFMDQDFSAPPSPEGFEQPGYDDSGWSKVPYRRYAHGGERNRDEALYLRKTVNVDDFESARLNIETVRPSGVIYINGKRIREVGRIPDTIEVSEALTPNEENLIAVRVDPYEVDEVRHHMSTDKWSSWFAGLMDLELTSGSFVKDVFAYTTDINGSANVKLNINAVSEHQNGFSGQLVTEFYSWFPEESNQVAAQSTKAVQLEQGKSTTIEQNVTVEDPELWTADSPQLYKVRIELQDQEGNAVDDYVLTTGLRTISQRGGTFRINGEPEVLFGPLIFNQPYSLGNVSQWMFSPPESKWMESILETKKMNGNVFRMSVHDKAIAGVNDRRLAQIADQMGMMLMWQTPCWIREGGTDDFDFKALPKYVKAVENHPSIVIWQPGNHPSYSPEWYGRVLEALAATDPSRLISPAADLAHMNIDSFPGDDGDLIPGWTHPQLVRGNMEQTAAYGADWREIRKLGTGIDESVADFNDRLRMEYLNSDSHAWVDFESEETIGMPNWNLHKGKPYYHMYSYEKDYNEGNLGRVLKFSEWKESQAWQALSAYEAYRKKRWLDYDGMNWCPLRGGPNTATYMKPVIEYSGQAKLGFYTLQMVYQRVLAGSRNVDLVYGPEDTIPVIVMNIGKSGTVDVRAVVKTMEGEQVAERTFTGVELKGGRTVTEVANWNPELEPGKYYGFEYYVMH
ncbi:MAG: glycoside hydrolase family 2 TIM barrel-domain containing protein [Bacteroidota bacterium]